MSSSPVASHRSASTSSAGTRSLTRWSTAPGFDDLLDDKVDSACWDSLGNPVYARAGILYKHTLNDLKNGRPGVVHDLEPLTQNAASDLSPG